MLTSHLHPQAQYSLKASGTAAWSCTQSSLSSWGKQTQIRQCGKQLVEPPLNTKCILCWLTTGEKSTFLNLKWALDWGSAAVVGIPATYQRLLPPPPNNSLWKSALQPANYCTPLQADALSAGAVLLPNPLCLQF